MYTVEEALKAREEKKKKDQEEKNKAANDKVEAALEERKKRMQNSAKSATSDLAKRINEEIEVAKTISTPSWSEDTFKSTLDSTRKNRLNIESLTKEVESYKSYFDGDTYNALSSTLASLKEAYDSHLSLAEASSKFDSEEEFKKWYDDVSQKSIKEQKKAKEELDIMSTEDFDKYSKLGANIQNPTYEDAEGWMQIGDWRLGGADIGNIVTFSRDNIGKLDEIRADTIGGSGNAVNFIGEYKYQYLSDNEVAIYNYYLGKGEKDKADEYLASLEDTLNERYGKAVALESKSQGRIVELSNVFVGDFAGGIQGLTNLDNYIKGTEGDPTHPYKYASDEIKQNTDGGWGVAYDLTGSIGNMLPSILVGTLTGGVGGAVTLGLSAMGNAYSEMRKAGYGEWQSRGYGFLVGASEAVFSSVLGGISKLAPNGGKGIFQTIARNVAPKFDKALARVAIQLGGNLLDEGLEEALQEVLDPVWKMLATGEDFEAAEWEDVWYSGLLGILSAGVLEGIPTIAGTTIKSADAYKVSGGFTIPDAAKAFWKNKNFSDVSTAYNESKQNRAEFTSALVNESLEIDPDNAHAARMKTRLDNGKGVSGYQINRLMETNESTMREQDRSAIQKAAADRLTALGETGDVTKLSKALTKYAESLQDKSVKLTRSEENLIKNSKYGQRVANELAPGNINSGEYSTAWSEKLGTNRINYDEYNKGITEEAAPTAENPSPAVTEAVATTENAPATEIATEGKIEASEDAKITIERDGKEVEVNVAEFASIEDGKVKLQDGEVVNADEINFGGNGVGLVYQAAIDMATRVGGFNTDTANVFVRGYDPEAGLTAAEYVHGFRDAYRFGTMGYHVTELENGVYTSKLTDEQRTTAYNFGKAFGNEKVANKQAKIASTDTINADKNANKGKKKGKLHFDGSVANKNLTERQRASLKGLRVIAESLGVDIYVFESPIGKDGKRQGANGWYDPSDNSIHIDLYSGANGDSLMLFTAAHELTHFIRAWSPAKFKTFADFLLKEYGIHGKSIDELVQSKMETLKENGRITADMTEEQAYDLAYEEVIADSCEAMLTDSDAISKIAELKAKDETLWQKIKDFITKLVARITKAYEGLEPDSVEGRYVREMKVAAEKLQALWTEALVDAGENYTSAEKTMIENGIEVNSETDSASLMSVRYLLDDVQHQKVAEALSKRFGVTEKEAKAWISAETSLASLILNPKYSQYLDYTADPNEQAIKSNSDYPQGTVDFSNICKKRRDFTEVMNRVLRNFPNHVFEATDLAKIRTIMMKEGMEVACGICYVEDRRQLDSIVAQDFIDSLDLYRKGSKTRPDGKAFNANQLKALKLTEGDSYTPSIYELISLEGRNSLKAKNPAMEEAWVKFNNARGMQSVRLLLNDAEYNRQILKYTPAVVKRKNDLGGLRIYSFSDMEMFHLIDIIQVITDSATVGLSLQGYTKVNEYAKAVKDTGEKLNRSLIPKGDLGYHIEDGKIVLDFDTVEGIDINHPDFFDNIDNPNVGNIVIGINATQIRAAMTSKFIDQIIPFHTGQSNEVLGEKGIASWANYKDFQSERDLSTGKKSSHQINIYTEVIQAAEAAGKPITNKVEFVNKFLEVCKENNLEPRFSEFLNVDENGNYIYTEGYHKFLVDFKTFDQNTGEYLPQMPVKPIFDNGYITQLLKDYVKSQKVKDAEFSKAMPKVLDRITKEIVNAKETKFSDRASSPYDGKTLYADSEVYDYSFMVSLDPMTVKTMPPLSTVKVDGRISQAKTVELGLKNAASIGVKVADDQYAIKNAYTKRGIILGKGGLQHSLDASNVSRLRTNARLSAIGGYIVQNAVPINGLAKENKQANGTYAMACLLNDGNGFVVAIVTVDEFSSKATNFDFVEITHSINGRFLAKKEDSRSSTRELELGQESASTTAISKISIAEFLEIVNSSHQSILSNDVLAHFGETRNPDGHYAKRVLFSDRASQKETYAPTFYSHMGKVIDDIRLEKMGAGGVVSYLKGKGVKNEEIKWSGIEAFLEGKKSVTKAELQEFVAGSQLQIEEEMSGKDIELRYDHSTDSYTVLDGEGDVIDTYYYDADRGGYTSENDDEVYEYASDLEKEMRWAHGIDNAPRHSEYRLEGGTNYRELVFKLPNSSYSNNAMRGHWGQEAEGVLAHARMQDFDVNGKKMLFIEEIQSDWHNEGREKGYSTKEYEDVVAVYDRLAEDYANKNRAFHKYVRSNEFLSDPDEVRTVKFNWLRRKVEEAEKRMQDADRDVAALEAKGAGDTPDAPFRTTYHEYVLKRLLRMAAEEGYDSIGWTTADIQSERWSADYAEGYRIEYDQDIPKFLKKYGKRWGAKVGTTAIEGNGITTYTDEYDANFKSIREWVDFETARISSMEGSDYSKRLTVKEDGNVLSLVDKQTGHVFYNKLTVDNGNVDVWSMDIPDSMKDSVLYEGQSMYSDRNPDSVSNRSLLANALESVAQNDIERNKLKEYKGKIALIESEQAKLSDLRGKIKDLSFAKGPRDTEAIKQLQFEANQAANRINTYDRQLLNLESTKALKGVLEREKQMAYKKAEKRGKDALARYKEKAADTQRELMTRYQEARKKGVESRHKTEMRHKIKDVVNELNQYLLNGTKEKHVPIELQKAVAEALDAVNMDTVGAEERIAKKREEMMRAKTPEAIEKLAKEIEHIQEMGGNMAKKISRLKTSYDSIINSDDPLIANSHDEVISNTIDKVLEVVGETPLRDMSLYQLEAVYDMYRMVLHSIRATNKAFKAAKGEEIAVIANRVIADLIKQKRKTPYSVKGMQTLSEFDWNNLKPVYAFERIGSDTFSEVFNTVRAGEDTWAKDMSEAQAFREEQFKKYKYDSWDFKKRYGFTSTSGMHFELSLDQIMSLYAYSKRDQAGDHLKYGGFVFDGLTEIKTKNKAGITVTYQLKDSTAYNLSEETLAEIIGKLTPEQKAFADTMQDYLSTTMGEKGNEVSLALYDVKLFKEKNYFPLKSAPQYMAKAKEQAQGEVKIKNSGFTKETTPKAKNPIVLSSFMDVWAGHVNEMSMYHAFTLPLEDFYRVYNYHTPADERMETVSVDASLRNAHGEAAVKYVDQLLKDLNGGARSDPRETLGKAMMANFKKASVMASLSVVIQQPSAIVRATALVDAKYFAGKKVSKGKHSEVWAEVKKYAPVAVIKEMGYFDTGMGKSSVEWLKGEKTFMDKVDDATSKLPALADELTWCSIWNAVKREVAHNNPKLKTNSEEFLQLVGERFTEVIVKTQVYDSTLARSANMRSKSGLMNMWTAFMAEPTTSINMLQDAFRKGNKKYIARTLGAVYGSVILNSALVSIVYAMRDDDEDETFLEKYLSRFATEVIDGINPITYIPFFKDIWSVLQGFDVERADMSLITKFSDSLQQLVKVISKDTTDMNEDELAEHKKAVTEAVLSITDNLSSLTGIPVKNVRRDINGIINAFNTIKKDITERDTTAGSLGDNLLEDVKDSTPIWGWFPNESKGDKLYDAIINGDTAYIDRLKSGYKSDSSFDSAIRKALRDNDPRIKEAAKARYDGDIAEYMRIAKEIIAEGNFSQDNIVAAINSEVNNLAKDEVGIDTSTETDKVESIFKVDDFFSAIRDGDIVTAYTVKEEIIAADTENGKDRDEAEADFNSKFTSYLREQYDEGTLSDYDAKEMLVNYGGKSEKDAASKVQYWDFKKDYPDYDLSEEAVNKYYSDVKPSGISIDVYYDYSKQRAKCKGTDSNGDGKTDSGSVKAEVMRVINALPITRAQKDALYYLNGWSKSTLHEAPWR